MKALSAIVVGLGLAVTPALVLAHGSMETPISRVYNCFKEGPEAPKSAACKAVVKAGGTQPLYDWMEVNQPNAHKRHGRLVRNGKLCAGGRGKYAGLDLPRKDWRTKKIVPNARGIYNFVFHATTPHATRYFKFFITRQGWNRAKPLKWNTLRRFATVRAPKAKNGRFRMRVKLPANRTGPHVIYVIWQRSDSAEAFYSCSDVKIVRKKAKKANSVDWSEAGQSIAHNSLEPGTVVSFRVFDAGGGDVEAHKITIGKNTSDAARWPFALAGKVNAKSKIFRMGELDNLGGGIEITPMRAAVGNTVYRNDAYAGYSYHIDIDTP